MFKIKKIAALITAAAVLLTFCACSGQNELTFGTGNVEGAYYSYAISLSNATSSQTDEFSLNVKTTAGSAANLRLIKQGFAELAIVQNDILYDAVSGAGEFEDEAVTNVRAVAALYTEACQVVTTADSGIESIEDLEGKTVSIGEEDSGVEVNAEQILTACGLDLSDINVEHLSFSDSADALAAGKIDAFFCVAGYPTPAIAQVAELVNIRILTLDERVLSVLNTLYGGYTQTIIPAGIYHGQDEEITTVGVKAVLVATESVKSDIIEELTKILFIYSPYFAGEALDPTFATEGIACTFHEGAASYYSKQNIDVAVGENTAAPASDGTDGSN